MRRHIGSICPAVTWTRIVILAMCVLAVLFPRPATAQNPNVAGLIVNYGDGRVSYAVVPFDEDRLNGIALLERSGLDLVSVGFGGLGDAVCQIEDTGCSIEDCRSRMCQTSDRESPYWQFSKLSGDGEWQFVATGASGARVENGDIYAWSWTGTTPELPVLTLEELADRAGGNLDDLKDMQVLLQTEGGETDEDSGTIDYVSIVAVAGVIVVAGALVLRSRRAGNEASA